MEDNGTEPTMQMSATEEPQMFNTRIRRVEAMYFMGDQSNAEAIEEWVSRGSTDPLFVSAWNPERWRSLKRANFAWSDGAKGAVYNSLVQTWFPIEEGQWVIHEMERSFRPCPNDEFEGKYLPLDEEEVAVYEGSNLDPIHMMKMKREVFEDTLYEVEEDEPEYDAQVYSDDLPFIIGIKCLSDSCEWVYETEKDEVTLSGLQELFTEHVSDTHADVQHEDTADGDESNEDAPEDADHDFTADLYAGMSDASEKAADSSIVQQITNTDGSNLPGDVGKWKAGDM